MPVLKVNAPDAPPQVVQHLHGRSAQAERTCADGACAIHSVFGDFVGGQFVKAKAMTFLRDTFGPTAGAFASRLNDATLLQDIKNVLWQDLETLRGADRRRAHCR